MKYQETLDYLYSQLPMFQRQGAAAYKNNLDNSEAIDQLFNHPHQAYKTIHVAGTNGKGSVSHTLSAILQSAGYRVGLYTSPHLIDFRERIRVNGAMIPQEKVVDFVQRFRKMNIEADLYPSFFELTSTMAFDYFASEKVDIAVIEVGLGGRLDSTNVISPDLCVITNISFDHTNLLGDTLAKIAAEKAGIIKPNVPVVIGESKIETSFVFISKATDFKAPILFADSNYFLNRIDTNSITIFKNDNEKSVFINDIDFELKGFYQDRNLITIAAAIEQMQKLGWKIDEKSIRTGLSNVCQLTGLQGRWQTIGRNPLIICDTGHNEAGISYVVKQIEATPHNKLHIVFGVVNDKAIDSILQLLPKNADYYFTKANIERALDEKELRRKALIEGLNGLSWSNVPEAFSAAIANAKSDDLIFVGGSTFVVADLLAFFGSEKQNK